MTTFQIIQSSTSYATTKLAPKQNTNSTLLEAIPVSTTTTSNITDASPTDTDIEKDYSEHFISIPFAIFLIIVASSALVFLIARNRRRLSHLQRSEYTQNFEDDFNSEQERGDFDDPSECLLKGKLQIHNVCENYNSTLRKGLFT